MKIRKIWKIASLILFYIYKFDFYALAFFHGFICERKEKESQTTSVTKLKVGGGGVTSAPKNCLWVERGGVGVGVWGIMQIPPSVAHSSPVTHLELSPVEFKRGV